jgi:hypothetical protein
MCALHNPIRSDRLDSSLGNDLAPFRHFVHDALAQKLPKFQGCSPAHYIDRRCARLRPAHLPSWHGRRRGLGLGPNDVHPILIPFDPDDLRHALSPVQRGHAGVIQARGKRTGHFRQKRFGTVATRPCDDSVMPTRVHSRVRRACNKSGHVRHARHRPSSASQRNEAMCQLQT